MSSAASSDDCPSPATATAAWAAPSPAATCPARPTTSVCTACTPDDPETPTTVRSAGLPAVRAAEKPEGMSSAAVTFPSSTAFSASSAVIVSVFTTPEP